MSRMHAVHAAHHHHRPVAAPPAPILEEENEDEEWTTDDEDEDDEGGLAHDEYWEHDPEGWHRYSGGLGDIVHEETAPHPTRTQRSEAVEWNKLWDDFSDEDEEGGGGGGGGDWDDDDFADFDALADRIESQRASGRSRWRRAHSSASASPVPVVPSRRGPRW